MFSSSAMRCLVFYACSQLVYTNPLQARGGCSAQSGFDIQKVLDKDLQVSNHSWEFGTASEAILELYNPELSVFGKDPFPRGKIPKVDVDRVRSLTYAKKCINVTGDILIDGDGAVGDPASLGVYALLIGNSDRKYKPYLDASNREAQSVLKVAPRFWNGAISHRYSVPELWADFLFMAPPFLAYYAVSTNNPSLLRETVKQATLYRQILLHNTTEKYHGLWEHIIGEKPNSGDRGLWSTGNGWAAAGMTRVLATVMKWPTSAGWRTDIELLKGYIKEILDGAMAVDMDNGLLRNYLNDKTWFGETSGTAILTAQIYRLATLFPSSEFNTPKYIQWAEKNRKTIAQHVDSRTGIVSPAINPLNWGDRTPFTTGSPEGQSFTILLHTAWRDWLCRSSY